MKKIKIHVILTEVEIQQWSELPKSKLADTEYFRENIGKSQAGLFYDRCALRGMLVQLLRRKGYL